MIKIAIDAMGADHGVQPIIDGLLAALKQEAFFAYLIGDCKLINQHLKVAHKNIEIIHCDDYIRMEEQASVAARRKESSIYVAMELLKNNQADALISAGHSGATMSLATLRLGRIAGVSRPAICTMMPTIKKQPSLILDAGANTDCKPEFLKHFAIMGYEYAKNVLGYADPRVGLLANGEEDSKGNELTKEAFKLLRPYSFFKGNVEGNDIFNGSVDVIVCDGYSGNIVLKASEGVASSVFTLLKSEIKKSPLDHIKDVLAGADSIPDYFLLPDQILLLNFNYTTTADMYLYKNSGFEVNHIHGKLGDDLNHIIFGYGDEMDDDYKIISKLNDNDYLTNIKSIRYLETDKYRQLLRFINSDYYQIYIMGHSCGNSDRTLLNTLFEHPKCVSIKPFYYQWQDERGEWQDNYIEIIQNISRNFNSMQTMRDRVVNKEFCRPLVPKDN